METRKRRFTLDELMDRITPENLQEYIDTGPEVGNEIVQYLQGWKMDEKLKSKENVLWNAIQFCSFYMIIRMI